MNRIFLILLLLHSALLHTVASAAPPIPAPETQAAIEASEKKLLAAVLKQDNSVLEELLAADFVYVHENGLISTKTQFLKDFVSKGYAAVALVSKEAMRQYGDTVITINTGHFQLKSETPYPPMTVTHIWVEQGGKWLLAHRHECHKGEPIGKQLSQRGGTNLTGELGSKPSPEVAKLIAEREASWVYSMLTSDEARMDEMMDESLRYVHVTGHTTDKRAFMKELRGGYPETYFLDTTMRQFGDTVLVLHRAQYRHTGGPEQSPGEALHIWVKRGDRWMFVGRQSARFENY